MKTTKTQKSNQETGTNPVYAFTKSIVALSKKIQVKKLTHGFAYRMDGKVVITFNSLTKKGTGNLYFNRVPFKTVKANAAGMNIGKYRSCGYIKHFNPADLSKIRKALSLAVKSTKA